MNFQLLPLEIRELVFEHIGPGCFDNMGPKSEFIGKVPLAQFSRKYSKYCYENESFYIHELQMGVAVSNEKDATVMCSYQYCNQSDHGWGPGIYRQSEKENNDYNLPVSSLKLLSEGYTQSTKCFIRMSYRQCTTL